PFHPSRAPHTVLFSLREAGGDRKARHPVWPFVSLEEDSGMRRMPLIALALAVAACGSDLTSGTPGPVISHDVAITARLGGRGPSGDTVTLHIANGGTGTAYFPQCGNQPLLLTQQFVNGQWI